MNFDVAFDRLMGAEGGYVDDPNDPGGETNWGISKRAYPNVDIKNLTRDGAKVIYLHDVWQRLHLDAYTETENGIAFQVFDFAVNSGIETAVRYLQRAIGVADDGWWGPVSQATMESTSESDVIMLFNAERLDFMTRLKNWPNAGRGWARRIAQNLRYGSEDS